MRITRIIATHGRVHHAKYNRIHQRGGTLRVHHAHATTHSHAHSSHGNLDHLKSQLKHLAIDVAHAPKPKPKKYVSVRF